MTDSVSVILHKMFIHIKNSINKGNYTLAQQIQKYLDENIERQVTIEILCHTFGYSKNHIINSFKHTYGITPYRYFLNKKIDVAKLYLSNTRYPVNEIARLLAYTDQNYFSAEFKRSTGMSPSEYRGMMNS